MSSFGKNRESIELRRLDRRSVFKLVEKRARTSGILKRVCCHSFRATGVTEYMNSGGTIEIAQRIAGHTSPATTRIYDRSGDRLTLKRSRERQRSQTRHNYRLANSGTRTGLRAWSSSRSTKTPSSPGTEKAVIGSAPQQEHEQKYPLDQHWSKGLTLTSLKSSAFVNLRLVINGPNEFAKGHQAQTH